MHNLPNKPLTGGSMLQNPENKGDDLQNLESAGVMVLYWSFGKDTSLRLVDSVATLNLILSTEARRRM
jgi:hypothetical protein